MELHNTHYDIGSYCYLITGRHFQGIKVLTDCIMEILYETLSAKGKMTDSEELFRVPIQCMGILHIRILWIFPIKNVAYIAFRKFHLHGVF